MAQSTDIKEGALTHDTATNINNNFTELYQGNVPPVVITAATTLTPALHANKTIVVNNAAGFLITLPKATGTGNKYRFFLQTTITSVGLTIQANNTAGDTFYGFAYLLVSTTQTAFAGNGDVDLITLNGSTTGGFAGDYIELEDVLANVWRAELLLTNSSSGATPFSDT